MFISAEVFYEGGLAFELEAGIEDAEIKITDWCTLTGIKLVVEIRTKPLDFSAMIEATFVMPAPTFKGTNDDYTQHTDGSFCVPNPLKYNPPYVQSRITPLTWRVRPMCCMGKIYKPRIPCPVRVQLPRVPSQPTHVKTSVWVRTKHSTANDTNT